MKIYMYMYISYEGVKWEIMFKEYGFDFVLPSLMGLPVVKLAIDIMLTPKINIC